MSTNNLSTNNNASQTLFRFATSRNAELSDPKNKERRFIFRKDTQKGVFDAKLNLSTTLQRLCDSPSSLPLTIETEQSLKAKDSVFYDLAVWVARNKSTATKTDFDAKIKEYKDYLIANKKTMLSIDSSLWDNLAYQVTTQKDFYAKEILMQFLHLNHILTVYVNGDEEVYNDVIKAKVVLPKELFNANNGKVSIGTGTSKMADQAVANVPKVVYNEKNMKFADAKLDLQANQNLASAIDTMEKSYRKQYQRAYQEALDAYENKVAPARKEYQSRVEEANNRKKMIESRIDYLSKMSIAHPELFLKDERSQEELRMLNEELAQTIPAPELPEFIFEFQPEIEAGNLQRQLAVDQQGTLNRILQDASTSLGNISTFAELNQLISQSNQALQQTVLDNTVLPQQISATVGGVVVPVTNSVNTGGWIPYSVKTSVKNNSEWYLQVIVENFAHKIVSGNYKVIINGTELSSNVVFEPSMGISLLFYNSSGIPASLTARQNGFILKGEVILEDGKTYLMDVTLIQDSSDFYNVFKQGVFKGSAAFIPVQKPVDPENPTVTPAGAFIPSGFGMKNIGITDYKKVEQSTYCYVEGDVAHIENIMAREYKERATRRLKRSESQTTKSSESEKEKLTDTTSTERHEMQSEVAKILQESKDFAAQAGFSAKWGSKVGTGEYGLNVGANYATHNSKEESNRQAVTEAKDITARALDRIVTKVKEERIDKILEEFEENNKHGFDNTKGNNHVVGVYRWVDKVVKNQIYNYGKRMMFEFMIPEPAKLHNLGMKISNNAENQLIKPVDPRKSAIHKMENHSALEDDIILKYWAGIYNVEFDEKPEKTKFIGKAFSWSGVSSSGTNDGHEVYSEKENFQLPEGYYTKGAKVTFSGMEDGDSRQGKGIHASVGNLHFIDTRPFLDNSRTSSPDPVPAYKVIDRFMGEIPISVYSCNHFTVNINISLEMELSDKYLTVWQQKVFNKIIKAYETELTRYEQALAGVRIKGSNPGFYRKIENTILRRNCISYMLEQNPSVDLTFGRGKYYNNGYSSGEETFLNTDIKVDGKLDQYAAFVKFMEQAFEWEIMSYYFYPYYWGERKSWADLYQFDDNDPTFRAFMQSGMARVIVTVRPGFEEAVRHFLATGQIWNGGEVPVIDDPLFLSIVDEMRSPKATKEGEPWREKIPTSLTILQADSIGLRVEKALPCNCEPGVKFDDNLGEMCGSNFELNENQIGQSGDKWMEISFQGGLNNYLDTIKDMDNYQVFPRKYECLGNIINIDRDASWLGTQSSEIVLKTLAEEISQIEGVEARSTGNNGITFKINVSKIKNFTFTKPGGDDSVGGHELLKFSVDLQNSTLKIASPEYDKYGFERILDKDGQVIPKAEYLDKVPLSKFLV